MTSFLFASVALRLNLIHCLVSLNHVYTLSFFPQVVRLWNTLPKDITNIQDKTNFSKKVESFLG